MNKIIATVGPSLLNRVKLPKEHDIGFIFRINGAHGSIADINAYIDEIRAQISNASILIDLPGNKVRTRNISKGIQLTSGNNFTLGFDDTNYSDFYKHLNIGDTIWANDSTFEFELTSVTENIREIDLLSKSNGVLENNKGLHVRGIHSDIPFLFQKDLDLIELANKCKVDFVGLSFVRDSHDIGLAKKLLNSQINIISKVETEAAVKNLKSILDEVTYILVDRGDLSTEVGLLNVPHYQDIILQTAADYSCKVFLATQFLKNMEINPIPSIPEIMDLYSTIQRNVYGIQMSEETAVGNYPIECLNVLIEMTQNIKKQIS